MAEEIKNIIYELQKYNEMYERKLNFADLARDTTDIISRSKLVKKISEFPGEKELIDKISEYQTKFLYAAEPKVGKFIAEKYLNAIMAGVK